MISSPECQLSMISDNEHVFIKKHQKERMEWSKRYQVNTKLSIKEEQIIENIFHQE